MTLAADITFTYPQPRSPVVMGFSLIRIHRIVAKTDLSICILSKTGLNAASRQTAVTSSGACQVA